MNEQSAWRLEAARWVAGLYAAEPTVEAILIGGSAARGWADKFSDVEIGVFWREFPPAAMHERIMQAAGGANWELDPFDAGMEDVQYEEYSVGGLKMDMRHTEAPAMERILAAVVDGGDEDDDRQQLVSVGRHGVPIYGEVLLASWRERAGIYPEARAREIVLKRLDLPPWWSVPMYAERRDLPLFCHALFMASEAVFRALCALNREYFPGVKWMTHVIAAFPVKPSDAAERLTRIFRAEPGDAAEEMRQLIEEMFDLAERELPGLDLTRHRADFRAVRATADAPTPKI